MPARDRKLTINEVRKAISEAVTADVLVRDTVTDGLQLHVSHRTKVARFQLYKMVNGKREKKTLWTLQENSDIEAARNKVAEILFSLRQGKDLHTEKLQAEAMNKTVEEWLADYSKSLKPNSIKQAKSQIKMMGVGKRPLLKMTVSEARELLDEREQSSSKATAAIALRVLSAMWEFAAAEIDEIDKNNKNGEGVVIRNPFTKALKRYKGTQVKRKTDFASVEQLREFIKHLRMWGNAPAAAAEVLVLTGMRLNEIVGLRFDEINWEKATVSVPPDRMKGNKVFTRPAGTQVMSILKRQRELASGEFVFPGDKKSNQPTSAIRTCTRSAAVAVGLPHLSRHGLRRSFITIGHGLGIPEIYVKQLTNHAFSSGAHAAYVMENEPELRETAQKIEDHILGDTGASPKANPKSTDSTTPKPA
jgi:integrase